MTKQTNTFRKSFPNESSQSTSRITCYFCNKKGHHIKRCRYRKNPDASRMVWVRKDTIDVSLTHTANRYGPSEKQKWVPRIFYVFDVGNTSKSTAQS